MGDPGLLQELPDIPLLLSQAGGDREQAATADSSAAGLDAKADFALNHRLAGAGLARQRCWSALCRGSPGRSTGLLCAVGVAGRCARSGPMVFAPFASSPDPAPAAVSPRSAGGAASSFVGADPNRLCRPSTGATEQTAAAARPTAPGQSRH